MNVLSLFDGISCGRLALKRAGIPVEKYYAAEIDKYASAVARHNWPGNIELGDVTKWRDWDIDWSSIDLVIGGSPCTNLSNAGNGKGLKGEQSRLFYVFVNILNHVRKHNQNVKFLLENVRMKKEWRDEMSELMGVEPVLINSALVSAQNRERYYWCNWKVSQPADKGIILCDVLETPYDIKSGKRGEYKKVQTKASCLTEGANSGGNHSDMDLIGCKKVGEALGIKGHDCIKRVYSIYAKSPTLTTLTGGNQFTKIAINDYEWRRYTPIECERLQTLPDNYTAEPKISNSARYRMIGNGWTVDVIAHIFKHLKNRRIK